MKKFGFSKNSNNDLATSSSALRFLPKAFPAGARTPKHTSLQTEAFFWTIIMPKSKSTRNKKYTHRPTIPAWTYDAKGQLTENDLNRIFDVVDANLVLLRLGSWDRKADAGLLRRKTKTANRSKTRMKLAKTIVQWNDIKHIRRKTTISTSSPKRLILSVFTERFEPSRCCARRSSNNIMKRTSIGAPSRTGLNFPSRSDTRHQRQDGRNSRLYRRLRTTEA